jgi:hypothetical protein
MMWNAGLVKKDPRTNQFKPSLDADFAISVTNDINCILCAYAITSGAARLVGSIAELRVACERAIVKAT